MRQPLGSPYKNYNLRWIFEDAKFVIIGVAVLALLVAPCAVGYWYKAKQERKQQIFDSAIAACPVDRTKMMCMRNIEKMHETCLTKHHHPDKPKHLRFNYRGYRKCVGVPLKPMGQMDLSKMLTF